MPSQNGPAKPITAEWKVNTLASETNHPGPQPNSSGAAVIISTGAPRRALFEVCLLREYPFLVPPDKEKGSTDFRSTDGVLHLRAEAPAGAIFGLPTIDDAGILMYVGSELRDLLKKDPACREVTFKRITLLRGISRSGAFPGGNEYTDLAAGLARLSATQITTNIGPDGLLGEEVTFSFLEIRKATGIEYTVKVSEWFAAAVAMNNMMCVPEYYFGLSKGYERWICRLIWKKLAQSNSYIFSLKQLHMASGSGSRRSLFISRIKNIVDRNAFVGYEMTWMADPVNKRHRLQVSVVGKAELFSEAA